MRLFVAGYPGPQAHDHLRRAVEGLRISRAADAGVGVRLVAPANWHVTLAFLGEVDDTRLPDVETAIGQAVAGWRSTVTGPPVLRLAGGGRFGAGRSTVLWVGVTGAVPAVASLGAVVRGELGRAGLPYDDRPFRAHLTLARPGDRLPPDAVAADRAALDDYLGPEWTMTEVVLVRSRLGRQPSYEPVRSWPMLP